jgi:hypothetical protein
MEQRFDEPTANIIDIDSRHRRRFEREGDFDPWVEWIRARTMQNRLPGQVPGSAVGDRRRPSFANIQGIGAVGILKIDQAVAVVIESVVARETSIPLGSVRKASATGIRAIICEAVAIVIDTVVAARRR